MRRCRALILVPAAVLALAACGRAGPAPAVTTSPTGTTRTGSSAGSFPLALPAGTQIAFALRQTAPMLSGSHELVASRLQALALTAGRQAYASCRAGHPLTPVGTLPAALAARWSALLSAAHLASVASDPPNPQGRTYWFFAGGRLVSLDFARHVRRNACRGTDCTAMLRLDPTLTAVLPASAAFSGFLASHCPLA